jgi:hypothetical protein
MLSRLAHVATSKPLQEEVIEGEKTANRKKAAMGIAVLLNSHKHENVAICESEILVFHGKRL